MGEFCIWCMFLALIITSALVLNVDESTNPPVVQDTQRVSRIKVTVCNCKEIQDASDWMFNQLDLIDYSLPSAPSLISNLKKEAIRLHCREKFIAGHYDKGVFIVHDGQLKDGEKIWK